MNKVAPELAGVKTVAIAGHMRPDGDCTGSCLGMYNYITSCFPAIEVDLYLEPIPNIFKFLKNADKINSSFDKECVYDLMICQDCGDLERLGEARKYFEHAKKTICIDHHISNENFADLNYVFPKISSTSELIFELIEEKDIDVEIASCIYTGMIHDTGVFQYSSTSARTMEIAGILMNKGIPFSKIVDETFYTKTFGQNKILGKALLNSEMVLEDRLIYSVISQKEMSEFDVISKHLDGIVNQLRVTKGVEVAAFFYETNPKEYKVSLRSNGKVDVAKIAMQFGGGGHILAAGFSSSQEIDMILKQLMQQTEEQL